MRSRSSKQGGNKGGLMEIEKIKKLKDEPHLSGAYIRSLVKQLTSSRTKDPLTTKPSDVLTTATHDHGDDPHSPQNLTNFGGEIQESQKPHQQQPKKQVRRRLHTSRPYQERLLNMAEARREIVTALKFHRASMKQANEQQQHHQVHEHPNDQPFLQSPPPNPPPPLEQEERIKCRRNPRIYPSNTTTTNTSSNYLNNISYSSSFSCPPPPLNNPFYCPPSSIAPLPIIDNINLNLPNQPLGLNLNFHDFTNLDTTLYHNTNSTTTTTTNNSNHSMSYSYSSPSSSSSPPLVEDLPMMPDIIDSGLHPVLDDDEMAEIRSIGEQHEMEWNDTLNLVKSAWWFKFMKKMEINPLEKKVYDDDKGELDDGFNAFNGIMEFPAWMNANNNESCFLQQHLDDYYSEDYSHEPALPCMDIGEIDGMDCEWLA